MRAHALLCYSLVTHRRGRAVGGIEYCGRCSQTLRRSYLRIQPLTWHPLGSGGSLRLGAYYNMYTHTHAHTHAHTHTHTHIACASVRRAWRTACAIVRHARARAHHANILHAASAACEYP
jgi:hypothetical protein